MASLYTYSGSYDESWFYLVPAAIEIAGVPAINSILNAQKAILEDDFISIERNLKIVADCIENMISLLRRMYEKCNPAVFWKRIRQYSGGSKNSEFFPNGVFYQGVLEVCSIIF